MWEVWEKSDQKRIEIMNKSTTLDWFYFSMGVSSMLTNHTHTHKVEHW